METQIEFVVVGHHERLNSAKKLASSLRAKLLVDNANHGANWNHRRALEWALYQNSRVVVLEDDAVLTPTFRREVPGWLDRFPDALVSFYLGTGRPPQYQLDIAFKLIASDKQRSDFITLPRLIHGVCYSVPRKHLPKVLEKWNYKQAADYAVGDAYGGEVVYPCYSLVDHLDAQPVEKAKDNQPRNERRKAWRLHG